MTREEAIVIAKGDMTKHGYPYGPLIEARRLYEGKWLVEFAHARETSRCETSDPPSIILDVYCNGEVRSRDLM